MTASPDAAATPGGSLGGDIETSVLIVIGIVAVLVLMGLRSFSATGSARGRRGTAAPTPPLSSSRVPCRSV